MPLKKRKKRSKTRGSVDSKKKKKTPKRTRHQHKLAKMIREGDLAHGEPMPSDVLQSMTLEEQYVSSRDEFTRELSDRRSGMMPWHRLPSEVVQEAYRNRPAIAELVNNRVIRPKDRDIDDKTAAELAQLRWVKHPHPFYEKSSTKKDHAPIPKKLLDMCLRYRWTGSKGQKRCELERKEPTFLLDREKTSTLFSHVSVWTDISSFLDRQKLRFDAYWKDKNIEDFLESIRGNYGLDDNMHRIREARVSGGKEAITVYFADFYLDKCHRYSICILVPMQNVPTDRAEMIVRREKTRGESTDPPKNFHDAKLLGPPEYYCHTCLCDTFKKKEK